MLLQPVYSLPSMTMPPPTPVPSVTMSIFLIFFAAPAVASPRAAQFASLSICTAQANSGRNACEKHMSFMPRFVPTLSVQLTLSYVPGTPMPMLSTSSGCTPPASHSASASCFMSSRKPSGSPVLVGTLCLMRIAPSSAHSAALTLVPPKSIPIRISLYSSPNRSLPRLLKYAPRRSMLLLMISSSGKPISSSISSAPSTWPTR